MNNITEEELQRRKESRRNIVKTFEKYGRLYSKMLSQYSHLSDRERISLIRKFELSYIISEYYYMHRDYIEENDVLFKELKKNLKNIEAVERTYNRKNRKI